VVAVVVVVAIRWWWTPDTGSGGDILATVTRGDLAIVVTERGELESSKTVDIRCELEGRQNKIVEIVPEGTHVTKDQIVVKMDADDLTREFDKQVVAFKVAEGKAKAAKEDLEGLRIKSKGDIDKAILAATLALLERRKYEEGDYPIDRLEKTGAFELAEKELKEAEKNRDNYKEYLKNGFGTPEQLRLKELEVSRAETNYKRDKLKLDVLTKLEYDRQMEILNAKYKDAQREVAHNERTAAATLAKAEKELEAAEQATKLEESALKRIQRQLDRCVVKSPADGLLVYTHDRDDWDPSFRVQAGGMVFYQETFARLPDLEHMEAKVRVHESKVKKIKLGLKTEIRIESLPNLVLHGTVTNVATFSDSENRWSRGGAKDYLTTVKIEDLPKDSGLLPNMTVQVAIDVNHFPNVLMAPVQTVTQRGELHVAYVKVGGRIERREVVVGENNDKFIEIKEGVEEGEQLLMDARARNTAEMKAEEAKNPQPTTPREPQPGPPQAKG
jgi:HlyD family secretion protein